MSPAKRRKAARPGRPAKKTRKAAAPRKAGKVGRKPAAKGRTGKAKASGKARTKAPTRKTVSAHGGSVHAHCAATDPFGDPCQNVPRRPSTHCVIHSYLDR